MKLISNEEVRVWAVETLKIKTEHIIGEMPREWHRQAQLESCERELKSELKKVKEEIEDIFEPTIPMSLDYKKWVTYWKGKGIE